MIYFDAAATGGKKHPCVLEACKKHLENIANSGRSGHKLAIENGLQIHRFREEICEAFQLEFPQRVVFTKNCSEALNLGIFGMLGSFASEHRRGSIPHIVTTTMEHNSVLRPLFYAKNKGEIELTLLSPRDFGGVSAGQVEGAVRKNTRLVCINLVSNVTGGRSQVEEIAISLKKRGIPLLCDGAQGLGHFDFSAKNIDILCAPLHKALGGVVGCGFAYFSKNVSPLPISFGGTGTNSFSLSQGRDFPESFEVGTLNILGLLASKAGLENKMQDMPNIMEKMRVLTDRLQEISHPKLRVLSAENQCGIFSFLIDGYDSQEIANILDKTRDIACRGGLTCAPLLHKFLGTSDSGVCRVSLDEWNTVEEIDELERGIWAEF